MLGQRRFDKYYKCQTNESSKIIIQEVNNSWNENYHNFLIYKTQILKIESRLWYDVTFLEIKIIPYMNIIRVTTIGDIKETNNPVFINAL